MFLHYLKIAMVWCKPCCCFFFHNCFFYLFNFPICSFQFHHQYLQDRKQNIQWPPVIQPATFIHWKMLSGTGGRSPGKLINQDVISSHKLIMYLHQLLTAHCHIVTNCMVSKKCYVQEVRISLKDLPILFSGKKFT